MEENNDAKKKFFVTRWMQSLTQWVLHWADTPYAAPALGIMSFAESSFFPIPPDVLLIPMGASRPDKAIRFAAITSVASILGGMLGYLIGWMLFDTVGIKIIEFYGVLDKYYLFREWFEQYNFIIIMFAGLTPLPYKVFTITAGVAGVNFPIFLLGSIISRSARFMSEGVVCHYGDFFSERIFKMPVRDALVKYINWFALGMAVLGVAGFMVVKVVMPGHGVDVKKEFSLPGMTKPVSARLVSMPAGEEKEGLLGYRLTYIEPGNTIGAEVPEGPFPSPTKGEADIYNFLFPRGEIVLAANFFSDIDLKDAAIDGLEKEAGQEYIGATNGRVAFFILMRGKLEYLGGFEYPRYRLLSTGQYVEGTLAEFEGRKTDQGGNEIRALLEIERHAGVKEEGAESMKKEYRWELTGDYKLDRIE